MQAERITRRQALAMFAAGAVALVADGSLPATDDDATEAERRVCLAGLALVECWDEAASRFTGDAFVAESARGTLRILRDLEARYGRVETGRIVREVNAVLAGALGG